MILNELTQEQRDLIPVLVEKWTQWALTPTSTDAETIRNNIRWIFKEAKQQAVEVIVADTLTDFLNSVREPPQASGENSARNSIMNSVTETIWLWSEFWAVTAIEQLIMDSPVGLKGGKRAVDEFDEKITNLVSNLVSTLVGFQILDSVRALVGDTAGRFVSYYFGAYFWVTSSAHISYFEKIGALTDRKLIRQRAKYADALKDLALGFFADQTCIVLRKPVVFINDSGKLHNEHDRAVKWADDSGFYYLDGYRLEKEIWQKIMSKQLSFADLRQIESSDIRALAFKYNPDAIHQCHPH